MRIGLREALLLGMILIAATASQRDANGVDRRTVGCALSPEMLGNSGSSWHGDNRHVSKSLLGVESTPRQSSI